MGGNKITGYFRTGRGLLIFWSKHCICKGMVQGHEARNWQAQLFDTGVTSIPILWVTEVIELEFGPRFGWLQGLGFSLCVYHTPTSWRWFLALVQLCLFTMSNCTYSIVFCSYSLEKLGGFSLRKRHSFIFKRSELIPVHFCPPGEHYNLQCSPGGRSGREKGPGSQGKAQREQGEGLTENMEVTYGEQWPRTPLAN